MTVARALLRGPTGRPGAAGEATEDARPPAARPPRGGDAWSAFAKQVVDRAVAAAALLLAAPVMGGVAVVLRRVAGPPVLFRQVRAGLHGRPFVILKFRTMDMSEARCCACPDRCVGLQPGRVKPLPLTGWLRRTGLDELPQLWNVLRGDMSFVGPRPLLPRYTSRYTARQRRRLEVRPGITGWAQTHGRTSLAWPERLELDVWYAEHRTAWLDSRIVARTIRMAVNGSRYGATDGDPGYEFLGTGVPAGLCPVTGEPPEPAPRA